jgi:cation diffusion facilitator family transporter
MVGIKLSNKASDTDHQYGHERMECVAAILLSIVLFLVGIGIGYQGLLKILHVESEMMLIPGRLALVAAIASIFIKEAMYWYTRMAAKKINSTALMADAWHHRSDGLSSIGSFIGIFGARLGFPILDPLAAVVICIFILKVSYTIFAEAIGKMTDKACDEETVADIRAIVLGHAGVRGIDSLKTRLFGDKIYIDIEVKVDGEVSLTHAHDIAESIHNTIENRFTNVKHCMVHLNPD